MELSVNLVVVIVAAFAPVAVEILKRYKQYIEERKWLCFLLGLVVVIVAAILEAAADGVVGLQEMLNLVISGAATMQVSYSWIVKSVANWARNK